MLLQPGHFYLSESLQLQTQNARWQMHDPFYYGLAEITIDQSALANGWITLKSCTGVLIDGTPFSISDKMDIVPPSRSFTGIFGPTMETCAVYLGLPVESDSGYDPTRPKTDGQSERYRSKVADGSDGENGLLTGEYNFSLLLGDEALDGFSTLKIAILCKDANGKIVLQEDFIPPLLSIKGSAKLMADIGRLLGILLARSAALSQGRKQKADGSASFSSTAETAFKLLETINTYTPLINYYHAREYVHPFELFKHLTQFTGALTVFKADVELKHLTNYLHDNLSGTFDGLLTLIRTILETDIDADCIIVPYEKINDSTYLCKLANQRLLTSARFYLGVSANVSEKELIIGVAQRIKMSSRDRLDLLVSSAMPGIQLIHVSHTPDKLSTKPGYLYFALDQQSQFWKGIQSAGNIAFYFPNKFPELKMEMLALLE
jgi:type VI secretion system protein ImpJ